MSELEYEIPWQELLAPCPSAGHIVGQLLPPGFDRYLRVFHPFVPWDADPETSELVSSRVSWKALANEARVPYGPTLTYRQLEGVLQISADEQRRRWAVWEGHLERFTADALLASLSGDRNGSYFFAFGLPAIIAGARSRPVLYRADRLDARDEVLQQVRRPGDHTLTTPEYVWPENRSWIVCTDWDLTSTYVAAAHHSAIRVLEHPAVEAVDVHLQTRVDNHADERGT